MTQQKQYNEEMRFVLFPTKEKRSQNSPDWWGNITVNGIKYNMSGWLNKSGGIGGQISLPAPNYVKPNYVDPQQDIQDEDIPF